MRTSGPWSENFEVSLPNDENSASSIYKQKFGRCQPHSQFYYADKRSSRDGIRSPHVVVQLSDMNKTGECAEYARHDVCREFGGLVGSLANCCIICSKRCQNSQSSLSDS